MEVKVYRYPNKAIGAVLVGSELRRAVEERTHTALALYQAQVAKRTGALASSARASTSIEPVIKGQARWVGTLTVGGDGVDYAAAHEFGRGEHPGSVLADANDPDAGIIQHGAHDLNVVLENLHAF
ncbi:hypothetical protein OS122_02525 [Mycolicibacterium mucogenicum]|uniref:hypothetical protein n=1 Tax=Mycolicibacterium mucogenicum TaxID=56689 RepID=UPI00226AD0E5|nr:hypothetical protein [Mycolicibacterium mucogenicum]MCX8559774.1 hypothetical protein [Mycolicibacterium mucogenicum]